jgi:hypothetical protein
MRAVRSIAATVVLAIGVGTLAAGPPASASAGTGAHRRAPAESAVEPASPALAPSAFEVDDLAAAQGISPDEARERLTWQTHLPTLHDRAKASLGDSFAGTWVDAADGDRLKLGVAGSDAGDRRAAGAVVDALGLAAVTDVVEVRHSLAELQRASARLADDVSALHAGSGAPVSTGIRPDRNAVVLHLPATAATPATPTTPAAPTTATTAAAERTASAGAAAAAELAPRARAELGDMVEVVHDATVVRAEACVYPYCDPPLRAGIGVSNDATGAGCTGAFLARSRVDNRLFQMTAGHCSLLGGSGTWSTLFPDGSRHPIGPVHRAVTSEAGDAAILRVTNPTGWRARAWVYVTNGPSTTVDEQYAIAADGSSSVGQRMCLSGARSGNTTCGQVLELGVRALLCDEAGQNCVIVSGLGRASFCSGPGDSGGPVFANHTAYGLLTGGSGACDSVYQGVRSAENLLNVNVATGS